MPSPVTVTTVLPSADTETLAGVPFGSTGNGATAAGCAAAVRWSVPPATKKTLSLEMATPSNWPLVAIAAGGVVALVGCTNKPLGTAFAANPTANTT